MAERGLDILESAHEQVNSSLKPRSSVSPQKGLEKIESLENQRMSSQKRLKGLRALATGGLIALAAKGGIATFNEFANPTSTGMENRFVVIDTVKISSESEQTPVPTTDEAPETERAIYEKQIEEKYGILILGQKEGYERINKKYDETNEASVGDQPVARLNMDQLRNLDTYLSFIPRSLIAPDEKENIFAVSIWDHGTDDDRWAGMFHHDYNMISGDQNTFKKLGADGLSFLLHELGHKNDGPDLKLKLSQILEDRSFTQNPYYLNPDSSGNPDMYQVANTLKDFVEKEGSEGRANFFQTYGKGYERFMKALGPILDGGEFDPNIPREELAARFPKAWEIYELYKEIFEGSGFDEVQKELDPDFKYPEASQVSEDENIRLQSEVDKVSEKYNVLVYPSSRDIWTPDDVSTVESIIKLFPKKNFQSSKNSNRFAIILSRETESEQHTGDTVMLSPSSIAIEDGSHNEQLKAVGIIAHEYAHRVNMEKEFRPQQKLIDLLGGDKFLKYPETNYPKLFEKDESGEFKNKRFFTNDGLLLPPDEILSMLAEDYLKGYVIFRNTQYLFDPLNYYLDDISAKEFEEMERKSKGYEIFQLIKDEIFDGREYDSDYKHIPEIKDGRGK